MTSQNPHAQQDPNRAAATPLGFSMPSLKLLTETLEKFEVFKREQVERLKACKEMITRLHKRVETTETDNRRLKARVQSLESDNARLLQENAVYLRTQQTMDTAIHLACTTSHETMLLISDATRMTMPTMPASLSPEEQPARQPQPELSIVRKQPISVFQAPSANADAGPLEFLRTPPVAEEAPAATVETVPADNFEVMTSEIDVMLALEFQNGFENEPTDVAVPEAPSVEDAEGETKAA